MKLTNKLSGRSEVVGLALGVLFCFSVGAQESFEIARNAAGKPDFSGIHNWPLQLDHDEDGGEGEEAEGG